MLKVGVDMSKPFGFPAYRYARVNCWYVVLGFELLRTLVASARQLLVPESVTP